ncbi:MAG: hypothetical protein PVI03_00890 [Candidatus Thorarchaeota archaeon]|jgi:hypothetical protein
MNVRKIVWVVFFITMLMNFSALTMTSFMITFWPCDGSFPCVGESNPATARIFNDFGIPVMYVILIFIWLCAYVIFRALSKADQELDMKLGLAIQLFLLAVITPFIFLDFLANVSALMWIIWAT